MFIEVSLIDCFPNKKRATGQGHIGSDVGDSERKAEQGEHSLVRGHVGSSGQLGQWALVVCI